jgi:hypothetical protein
MPREQPHESWIPALLRIVLAVVAGYLLMAVLAVIVNAVMASLMSPDPAAATPGFMIAMLVTTVLAAIAAGWSAAVLAGARAHVAVSALISVVVLLGLIGTWLPGAWQPVWYPLAVIVVGASGVWIGGYRRQARSTRPARP